MKSAELFRIIDNPLSHYEKSEVAKQFSKLTNGGLGDNSFLWECIAFTFHLDNDQQLTGVKASAIEKFLTQECKFYLVSRLKETKHPKTIACYGHALWQFHKYHPGCKAAVEAYLAIASACTDQILTDEKQFNTWRDHLEPALKISAIANLRDLFEHAKQATNKLLLLPISIWMKNIIIDSILKSYHAKSKQFEINAFVEEIIDYNHNQSSTSLKEAFDTAITIDKLYGSARLTTLWEKKGDMFRAQVLAKKNDPMRIVSMSWMNNAMECYKRAKAEEKFQIASREYQKLKATRKVSTASVNLLSGEQGKMLFKYIEKRKDSFLSMRADDILLALASDASLLPSEQCGISFNVFGGLERFVTMVNFDVNQNPKILSDKGRERFNNAFSYKIQFQLFTQLIITDIMHKLIKDEQLTIEAFDGFFEQTWIGKPIPVNNDDENIDLYSTLRPALNYYIEQAKMKINGEEADFILCIDTLVLKYEMLIRFFLKSIGVPTTVPDSQNGYPRENYLPELLEKMPAEYFGEQDKKLMRQIYTKDGMDLRNNIAHSYLTPKSYTLELADTVVWSVMRLGQYTNSESLN